MKSLTVILGVVFGAIEALAIAVIALSPRGALQKASSLIHSLAAGNPQIESIVKETQAIAISLVASLQHLRI